MAEYKFILLLISLHCALVVGGILDEVMEWIYAHQYLGGYHSIIKGTRSNNPQDFELYNRIESSEEQYRKVHTQGWYCYPPSYTLKLRPPIVITRFEAVDMVQDGINSGEVFLESGGVGKDQVCFHILSKLGGTFKYRITVYGYLR